MEKLRFVGLDVHKDTIVVAVADADGAVPQSLGTFPNDVNALIKRLKKLGPVQTLRTCYEAGPTGLGLHGRLVETGITNMVVAPSLVPQQAGDRVKTDRRDAVNV